MNPARIELWAVLAAVLLAFTVFATAQGQFNSSDNILIADQFNNRVIEVDPQGDIVWNFGLGPADFSPASIIGVNDAERIGDFTLMAGTGTPGGQPEAPNCTNPNGCPDDRVILVDESGNIVWQYGQFGVAGSGFNELNTPVQATWLPSGEVLITDQANQRVIQVDQNLNILWQYGTTGVSGNGPNQLNSPNCALLLKNGNVLICDEANNRAIEVTPTPPSGGTIVWQYGSGDPNKNHPVSGVAFASRLDNGNTLITDSNHNRVIEIDANKKIVWQYHTCHGSGCNLPRGTGPLPTRAVRLENGNTLISDQYDHRVIEVNPAKKIVLSYGKLGVLGYNTQNVAHGGLNSPYDAKKIDDFTGLTDPCGDRPRRGLIDPCGDRPRGR